MPVQAVNDAVQRAVSDIRQSMLVSSAQSSDKSQQLERTSQTRQIQEDLRKIETETVDLSKVGNVEVPSREEMVEKVRAVIPNLNSVMHSLNLKLRFEEFSDSGRFFVRAIDVIEQKEVTRVPHQEFLKQAEVTKRFVNGLFLDQAR